MFVRSAMTEIGWLAFDIRNKKQLSVVPLQKERGVRDCPHAVFALSLWSWSSLKKASNGTWHYWYWLNPPDSLFFSLSVLPWQDRVFFCFNRFVLFRLSLFGLDLIALYESMSLLKHSYNSKEKHRNTLISSFMNYWFILGFFFLCVFTSLLFTYLYIYVFTSYLSR